MSLLYSTCYAHISHLSHTACSCKDMSKPERCSCCERGTQDLGRWRAQQERAVRDLLPGDPVPEGAEVVDVEVGFVLAHGVDAREAQRQLRRVQHRLDHAHVAVDLRARAAAGSASGPTAHSCAGRRTPKPDGALWRSAARPRCCCRATSATQVVRAATLACSGRLPQAGMAAAWRNARGSQGVRLSRGRSPPGRSTALRLERAVWGRHLERQHLDVMSTKYLQRT